MNLNDIVPAYVFGIPGGVFMLAVIIMAFWTAIIIMIAWHILDSIRAWQARRAEKREARR